ncbi:MAG: hypothetical protein DRI01_00725 [Chloroflexi bacterium]|nr:MAG: hypothetical protein DRI01_00725 [Chloroflexota bacterium]
MSIEFYIGDIATSRSENIYPPKVVIYIYTPTSLRIETFVLDSPWFTVSPLLPEPIKNYEYDTVNNERIVNVKGYRFHINIKMNFADREKWLMFQRMRYYMENIKYKFDFSGIIQYTKIMYYPPGDEHRAPLEVKPVLKYVNTTYLGNRYIGYDSYEIELISKKIYQQPFIPLNYLSFDITGDLQAFAVKDILPILPDM